MTLTAWMDRRLYRRYTDNWDDERFREAILARLEPKHHLLDLGAGAGIVPQMNFRGWVERVCGVDPDPRVTRNPFLDEGRVGVGEKIPYPDASFDIVVADNVLEHLDRPAEVFTEVARVLKPGGAFLAKTPNRNHYMPLVARLTPSWFHRRFNRMRGRDGEDTFPTLYRANSEADLRRAAARSGLTLEKLDFVEGRPEYLRFSAPTYLAGWAYERLVNATPALERLRILLVAHLRKPL